MDDSKISKPKKQRKPSANTAMDKAPPVTEKDKKLLYAKSNSRCAICKTYLLARDGKSLIGEVAHIVDESLNGLLRPDKEQKIVPLEKRGEIDNLLLLCNNCHQRIDDTNNLDEFTIEYLREIKASHEKSVLDEQNKASLITNDLPPDDSKFTGREAELAQLQGRLSEQNKTTLTTLHGMGGVGKTSLAIEYVRRYKQNYDFIAWLPAENPTMLENKFIELAPLLGLPEIVADTEAKRARIITTVKNEIARQHKNWLLVFDNVENPEDINQFRPSGTGGHILITSRNNQMAKIGSVVEINVLPEDDALRLLAVYCHPYKTPDELKVGGAQLWETEEETLAATQLNKDLGFLALAIIQAGSYITTTKCGTKNYLTKFKKTKLELFGLDFVKPIYYEKTVATTWNISFQKVVEQNQGAAEFLNLLAFFAPEGINLAWFTNQSQDVADIFPSALTDIVMDGTKLEIALAVLLRYALIVRSSDMLAVHRLVQLAVIERLEKLSLYLTWLNIYLSLIAIILPNEIEDYRIWPIWEQVIPHAENILHYLTVASVDRAQLGNLYNKIGLYQHYRGNYTESFLLLREAVKLGGKLLNPVHPNLIAGINNLGMLCKDLSRFDEAQALLQGALEISKKAFSSEHSALARAYNNLGLFYLDIGKVNEAKPFLEEGLRISEKIEGHNSNAVAKSLINLGSVAHELGDFTEAETKYTEALAIKQQILGPDDPSIAGLLNNLAILWRKKGNYLKAKKQFEENLAKNKRLPGRYYHRDNAKLLYNLSLLLANLGEYDQAKLFCIEAIRISVKILGKIHLDVAHYFSGLGVMFSNAGNDIKAKALLRYSVSIQERIFKGENSHTSVSFKNLAELTNEPLEKLTLLRRTLIGYHKSLGAEHHDTIEAFVRMYTQEKKVAQQSIENIDIASWLVKFADIFNTKNKREKSKLFLEYAKILQGKVITNPKLNHNPLP